MTLASYRGRSALAESDALVTECYSPYQQPWWLDAASPGQWEEVTVKSGSEVVARLPFVRKRRAGLTILTMPPLTQTLGPWLASSEGTHSRRLKAEKDLMGELIARLPPFDLFQANFSPLLTNTLPFYWAGFESFVRYTLRIEDLSDLEALWKGLAGTVRTDIRHAEKHVEVRTDLDVSHLLEICVKTFQRQGRPVPFSLDTLRRIVGECSARGVGKTLYVVDSSERVHAAMNIVWDPHAAYLIMGGRDHDITERGAYSLVMWEAIRLASRVTNAFDFTGSMIESVYRADRRFGVQQVPYFLVRKASRRMQALLSLRDLANTVRRAHR